MSRRVIIKQRLRYWYSKFHLSTLEFELCRIYLGTNQLKSMAYFMVANHSYDSCGVLSCLTGSHSQEQLPKGTPFLSSKGLCYKFMLHNFQHLIPRKWTGIPSGSHQYCISTRQNGQRSCIRYFYSLAIRAHKQASDTVLETELGVQQAPRPLWTTVTWRRMQARSGFRLGIALRLVFWLKWSVCYVERGAGLDF